MSRTIILTDSTAYLPKELCQKHEIEVIPLVVIWDEEVLKDGVDIQPDEFYKRLSASKSMPTTSQVTVPEMEAVFKKLLDKGDSVLGLFLSSKLSGTVQAAEKAREGMGKAGERIAVVDSLSTTMALGWQVLRVAKAAQAGESLENCKKAAEQARDNSGVLFVVETLEFLRRGGRIGGAQALLGTTLNIKPVLEMQEGRIESVEKIRTKTKALQRMLELTVERIGTRTPVRVAAAHANAEAEARALLEQATQALHPVETLCCPLSPVIGTHSGPGTIALPYLAGVE